MTLLRREGLLLVAALAMGALFFLSMERLWPMADTELAPPESELLERSRRWFAERGHPLAGYDGAADLFISTQDLSYVEAEFGRDTTQRWIREGAPLAGHRVAWKKAGEPRVYRQWLHAEQGTLAWSFTEEDDGTGARIPEDDARSLALAALSELTDSSDAFEEIGATTTRRPNRTDHDFVFESLRSTEPELRERVAVTIYGDRIGRAARSWPEPPSSARGRRSGEGARVALETIGVVLLAIGALAAFWIFLRGLQSGSVRLRQAAVWPGIVFAGLVVTHLLDASASFFGWDPLMPRWIAWFRSLVEDNLTTLWILLVLLAVYAAGRVLDRDNRRQSLESFGRGRWNDAGVGASSIRGFLVGLICGGVLALSVRGLEAFGGATVQLQPRGFFFYTLDSAAPLVTSIAFFLGVALTEELGYRFFGGNALLRWTGSRVPAIAIPALIYGLTHTRLDFLPPDSPWWGRALTLTLVGCVWGWAYFRYDALTVVLSHLTADLFIFNSPFLFGTDPVARAAALATTALPLLPALVALPTLLRSGPPPPISGSVRP